MRNNIKIKICTYIERKRDKMWRERVSERERSSILERNGFELMKEISTNGREI